MEPLDPLMEEDKKTSQMVDLMAKGQIHRAVERINSWEWPPWRTPQLWTKWSKSNPPDGKLLRKRSS